MRELKFRIWCKRTQEYHTPIDEEDYDADGTNLWLHMCIDTNGRLYFIETTNEDADFEYITHDCEIIDSEGAKNFIVEQYTGLKDKNGKEIYEGDIVKYAWTRCNYIVAYRKYDAGFVLENDNREEIILFQYNQQNDYEVIGNIHENGDLLND